MVSNISTLVIVLLCACAANASYGQTRGIYDSGKIGRAFQTLKDQTGRIFFDEDGGDGIIALIGGLVFILFILPLIFIIPLLFLAPLLAPFMMMNMFANTNGITTTGVTLGNTIPTFTVPVTTAAPVRRKRRSARMGVPNRILKSLSESLNNFEESLNRYR